jgi:hypothetical protein
MMHKKDAATEYSAPCKWDNDARYVGASGNRRSEIIAARRGFQCSEGLYGVLGGWLKQLGLMVTGIA